MEQKEYKTHDFYHAVILKTVGFSLSGLEKGNGKFSVFVFNDPESQAQTTIKNYWDHQIQVDARKIIENINELKTRLHSGV